MEKENEKYTLEHITWIYGQVKDENTGKEEYKVIPYIHNNARTKIKNVFSDTISKLPFFSRPDDFSKPAIKAFKEEYGSEKANSLDSYELLTVYIETSVENSKYLKKFGVNDKNADYDKYINIHIPVTTKDLQNLSDDVSRSLNFQAITQERKNKIMNDLHDTMEF